jgi:hypothetical protein
MKTVLSDLLVKSSHRVVLRELYNESLSKCDHDVSGEPEGTVCACVALWELIKYSERTLKK